MNNHQKLWLVGKCKLANQAISKYNEEIYGIECPAFSTEEQWLDLFLWAYEKQSCITGIEASCKEGGKLCNLEQIIGRITKFCKDCKPKKYNEPIITKNEDYACWYSSEEYLDCLNAQLEEQGYIESYINLCKDLNPEITVTAQQLCELIVSEIIANGVSIDEAYQNIINNI